jgi:hypothetical protein
MPTVDIGTLLPKQSQFYYELRDGKHSVIGIGGGRGSGKSSCLDRVILTLMAESKISVCMVMRNSDQIVKYHVKKIVEDFPWVESYIKVSPPASLTIGQSRLDFSYAETLDDVKRRSMSGNYDIFVIDQSEQFTEEEVSEFRRACRSTQLGKKAKLVLSFNMRGAGIEFHRKWFRDKDVPDPENLVFIKFSPWDNVFWSINQLVEDKLTIKDYYRWTDDQRRDYAGKYGDYTKQLAGDDQAISAADWFGSWDSIEGTYFSNVWDLEGTRIDPVTADLLRKDWAHCWISQDWGRAHNCVTYWHYRVSLSPKEANAVLGWELKNPINIVCTYREMIISGSENTNKVIGEVIRDKESNEVAQCIVDRTPEHERKKIKSYYLSPDGWDVKDSKNTVALSQGTVLKRNGMPAPLEADWSRKSGWALMARLMKGTKGRGYLRDTNDNLVQAEDVWLISNECPNLLNSIPMLMRDKKDIEDVAKTDKSASKLEMDCADSCRYGLKSMLSPKKKTSEDVYKEKFANAVPEEQMLMAWRRMKENENKSRTVKPY